MIFDCDGVLIDSEPVCNRVVAEALTGLGWSMTAEVCEQRFVGMSFHDMQPLVEAQLRCALPPSWIADLTTHVAKAMELEAVVVPGAEVAIQAAIGLGLDWRIASNSSHQEMAAKFGRTGLSGIVAGRLHSAEDAIAEGGRGKPAPDVFLLAARVAGAARSECLVIEDSVHGARAAAAAGMTCLGFCPQGDGALLEAEGAILFRSLLDLPDLLKQRP